MSESEFFARVHTEFVESLLNNFGKENFDELRFGAYKTPSLKLRLRRKAIPVQELEECKHRYEHFVAKRADDWNFIYKNLEEPSRELLVKLIAYRALGYRRVKQPFNNAQFWEALERVKWLKNTHDKIDPHFLHFVLEKFELQKIGYDIKLYLTDLGVAVDFVIEQYAYKRGACRLFRRRRATR